MSSAPNYGKKKLPELKKLCGERSIRHSGLRKGQIVELLEAYDRNADFKGPSIPIPKADPMPDWPPSSSFKSITVTDKFEMPQVRRV